MYGYIYKTTNLINGKIYIGQHHASVFDAIYKGSGVRLHEAFGKYGWENFSVELIEECQSKKELDEREKFWIAKLNTRNRDIGYNLSEGGERGFALTEESYKKIVATRREHNTISGWKQSKEAVAKRHATIIERYGCKSISGMQGKHQSEETKAKIRAANKGQKRTDEQKQRTSETTKLAMQRPDVQQKMSECVRRKWQDPEYRAKMSKVFKEAHKKKRLLKNGGLD